MYNPDTQPNQFNLLVRAYDIYKREAFATSSVGRYYTKFSSSLSLIGELVTDGYMELKAANYYWVKALTKTDYEDYLASLPPPTPAPVVPIPVAVGGTGATDAATAKANLNISEGGIAAGIIAIWSGLLANIPSGWALCDGQNGTPDLRDKFVVGAAVDPGATGGAAAHSHTYTEVVSHTHTVTVTDPGHTHVETNNSATTGGLAGWAARDTSTNTPVATGYSTGSSTTGITAATANPAGSVATGTTATASSLPPYYAVAFIMKT